MWTMPCTKELAKDITRYKSISKSHLVHLSTVRQTDGESSALLLLSQHVVVL